MWERFKQWPPKVRRNQWWMVGAIATPVLLGIVCWLCFFPDRRLQRDAHHLSHPDSATLAHPYRASFVSSMGAIATVASVVFLLRHFRLTHNHTATANLSEAKLSGTDLRGTDFSGADLNRAELNGANLSDANLCGADLSGADLNGAELNGANLSGANLSGANLISADLSGADLNGAELRYANLSGANLRYANLRYADLRYANLSGADLNCTFLSGANLSDANLSGALLFFINLREVLNLEPLQLEAKPSPFLCNVALPAYAHRLDVNPNRACDRIPQLLSARYDISLEEAQEIVYEARQHRWD